MESQGTGGSVRKNIALKLRDQGASPFSKVDSPPPAPAKKEDDVGKGVIRLCMLTVLSRSCCSTYRSGLQWLQVGPPPSLVWQTYEGPTDAPM